MLRQPEFLDVDRMLEAVATLQAYRVRRVLEQAQGHQVDQQPQQGDRQHRPPQHRHRFLEAPDRLEHDPAGDAEQDQSVDERRQDLEAMVAVAAARVGGPRRQAEGDPGQAERGTVGQHVAGIGQQRQGARQPAARRFDQHDGRGHNQGPADPALVGGPVVQIGRASCRERV